MSEHISSERSILIDCLKLVMAFGVVAIHTSWLSNVHIELSHLINNGVARLAVPLFYGFSGYFLSKIRSFKKYFIRILMLYILWMIVYSPIWFDFHDLSQSARSAIYGYWHLWYVSQMLLALLVFYVIKRVNIRILFTFSLLLAFLGTLLQYSPNLDAINFSFYNPYQGWSFRNFIFVSLPFLLMGYCFAKSGTKANYKGKSWMVAVALALVILESTVTNGFIHKPEILFTFLISVPLLLFWAVNTKLNAVILPKNIGKIATGVYFIHPVVIELSKPLFLSQDTLLVFLCSVFLSMILLKNSLFIRYMV